MGVAEDELDRRLTRWTELRDARHSRGQLRVTPEEVVALEELQSVLDALSPGRRAEALERVRRLTASCRCGHPEGHHLHGGRCFHVVGCATACECREWEAT